ncbi:MAG: bifunctional nuclease family protein, partial [Bacteroidales bacterium]|nr:bifunctional nuclease family protein [Bacteroidales bacterium]
SRTSDAIALALRFCCPVYAFEDIFRKTEIMQGMEGEDLYVGNFHDKDNLDETKSSTYSVDELREMLNKAIQDEDYEKASAIRDELQKRDK